MAIIDKIKAKAAANVKTIVLPEGEEDRNVQAAAKVVEAGLAKIIMLGDPEKVNAVAAKYGVKLDGIEIINPAASDKAAGYAATLYELRKAKGMTEEQAAKLVADPMYYGVMMVKAGDADGLVSGAIHSTGDMLRPALQIIKAKPGMKTVSSCFLIESPVTKFGDNGIMIFSDCAVNIDPDAEQLANIALGAADSARSLAGIEPRVAMLSFSTKGSAKHDNVTKVQEATRIAKEMAPDLMLDGELQLDAALVPSVGELKAPGSAVAGKANVLVFPDLQSGNIGYKLAQRLGQAEAYGPILQGIAKPCNDLSRGCSVDDIVATVAITAVQAQ
ncbi:MAG: phosphate acetyltransferase [Clostridia bacterium]|nr:phosphate acetyltransferase [Clostridia bacterium]